MKAGVTSQAIDLSLKGITKESEEGIIFTTKVLKPEPRPAWSILWYRSIWPKFNGPPRPCPYTTEPLFTPFIIQEEKEPATEHDCRNIGIKKRSEVDSGGEEAGVNLTLTSGRKDEPSESMVKEKHPPVTDIATCDGPVQFIRVSNPNFSLTVEHRESAPGVTTLQQPPTSKTYLCIYCNQSFKSLFCYQKHKKRHLNPVSVDITATPNLELTHCLSENTIRAADLNVQFFPCKKCGSKFPSYYFVHKHKKACEAGSGDDGRGSDSIMSQQR